MLKRRVPSAATLIAAGASLLMSAATLAGKPTPTVADGEALKERLGKALYFDKISQPAASMSCASCHLPTAGWTGDIAGINVHGAVYRGAQPQRFGNRKPPSSAYAAFSPIFHFDGSKFFGGVFWDGRATGSRLGSPVAEQALGPPLNPVEQNMPDRIAVCEHVAKSKYAGLFEQAWGAGSLDCSMGGVLDTYDLIGLSIGAYEASSEVNSFSSKFDDYWYACTANNSEEACGLAADDQAVLDPQGILTHQEFDGLIEFGEYCADCHTSTESAGSRDGKPLPPLFTNNGAWTPRASLQGWIHGVPPGLTPDAGSARRRTSSVSTDATSTVPAADRRCDPCRRSARREGRC